MKPAFSTERFDVFQLTCDGGSAVYCDKEVFVAMCRSEDVMGVACTVTIDRSTEMDYLEWVEVRELERRRGFATEIIRGIEKYLNTELTMDGATEAGDGFVETYCKSDEPSE